MVDEFHILVVEDEAILRKVISSVCARVATVGEAASGNEAIAYLKANRVDLVFTDLSMPDGTGADLLDWTIANHTSAPVVVLVTGETHLTSAQALLKGAHSIVDKPFRVRDLMHIAETIKFELDSGLRERSSLAGCENKSHTEAEGDPIYENVASSFGSCSRFNRARRES